MNGEIIMEVIDNKFKKLGDDLKNTIKVEYDFDIKTED